MEDWESDRIVEKWIQENDKTFMAVPSIESEPHLLISKVRKHYMEYLIKLLAVNYENNQKLLNKNIYLPSAIWRCAKMIEMSAAQASMVVHLYRNSITEVIKGLKKSTSKGALYRKLYECLHYAPENEKKVQATMISTKDCNCQCSCNQRKKVKRTSESPTQMNENIEQLTLNNNNVTQNSNNIVIEPQNDKSIANNNTSPKTNIRMSIDMPDSDDLTQQLDKLFQLDKLDENDDDLFDSALCMTDDSKIIDDSLIQLKPVIQEVNLPNEDRQDSHKCLDERLALISGILVNNETVTQDPVNVIPKLIEHKRTSKWLCEEYFQKVKLYELLDQIRDCDRKKYARVKERLLLLFGDDSDDEGVVSPLEETHDFISSCKERIAPWIVKILTPYYVKGRIRGKALFKSLVKHLIRLIYQCSKYPQEYEVQSFVKDFLDTHKLIRCEADFMQFRIENY
ncbi:uncharacterized protein LOC112054925 [Bicyclus anynana]|uniref:Uncharacterized protein LOC112054925 n=1 Tax=Bicyclus anynana TaxID=110368 RepID=A0A6J1NZ64_BICAN|nr:uncharacterized protein LOC112054925 [Bicyclus anynana]